MARARRLLAAWAVLAAVAALAGALAATGERERAPVRVAAEASRDEEEQERPPDAAAAPGATPDPPAPAGGARERRPRSPRGTGTRAVMRRAYLEGRVMRGPYRRWRGDLTAARAAARRLPGARGRELLAVLGVVDGLAAAGRLTPSRMPLAFLTLRRNTAQWRLRPFPRPAERMTFGRDPAVFQYFPGRGVQFHGLATAGRANALALPCLRAAQARVAAAAERAARRAARRRAGARRPVVPGPGAAGRTGPCRPDALARRLDRLVALGSSRGGFLAWEHLFAYGGGTPPWVSGMTQATAAQALARGWRALGERAYRDAALRALGAFETPPSVGVAADGEYLMYSFSPGLRVLNGFLQSLIGLHDVAELTGSPRARRLFRAGERASRAALAGYDTGAWSRYSLAGRESTLDYHRLVTGFLAGLCTRTRRAAYCDGQARFARYEREPPRIDLDLPALREARTARLRVRLSKVSDLGVTVRSRSGLLLARAERLPGGRHAFAFTPRRPGEHRVTVTAVGPEGRRAVARLRATAGPDPRRVARERAARRREAAARRRARERREARERRRQARPRFEAVAEAGPVE